MPYIWLPDSLYQYKRWILFGYASPLHLRRWPSPGYGAWFAIALLVVSVVSDGAQPPAPKLKGFLFGTVEFRSSDFSALPQWVRVLQQSKPVVASLRRCLAQQANCSNPKFKEWADLIRRHRGELTLATLNTVNLFFNERWPYKADTQNWGKEDWWVDPGVFLEKSGDCEDYAIIKYFTLKEIGFAMQQLRLVIVKDTYRQLDHAILSVSLKKKYYILDSLLTMVIEDHEAWQYAPAYSINEKHRWLHFQVKAKPDQLSTRVTTSHD